eukprot:7267542-Prymnesium_polylepis.1
MSHCCALVGEGGRRSIHELRTPSVGRRGCVCVCVYVTGEWYAHAVCALADVVREGSNLGGVIN